MKNLLISYLSNKYWLRQSNVFSVWGLSRKWTGPRSFSLWGLRPIPSSVFRELHWLASSTGRSSSQVSQRPCQDRHPFPPAEADPGNVTGTRHHYNLKNTQDVGSTNVLHFPVTDMAILISSWKQKKCGPTWPAFSSASPSALDTKENGHITEEA